ncbi:restriction endonuclease subunit S, partial [Prevotella sp. P2-180]|uniref:restriction endonuclease subunit S n=1 Tax=Prevotella sp. P2-180 TaxID=2024224 RepID=UPI0015551F87
MSEWKEVKLGDVCKLYSGGTPNKNNKTYWNGNIPWISAKSMYGDYIEDADLYITEKGLSNGSRLAPKGSILILTRGSGLYNRIPICYTLKDVAFNQDVKRIESKDEDLYPNDILYYI